MNFLSENKKYSNKKIILMSSTCHNLSSRVDIRIPFEHDCKEIISCCKYCDIIFHSGAQFGGDGKDC